ncbi:MAG TPA: chemotaxis-specific protein-glutamate methyltransferase CheB [Polyangia bacterium]|nr:chemotaxis-specific protein-glutamate methyltransferase CheB [Polyangia bacterium]
MTAARRLRVLVVDDSAFARKVLRETLSVSADIEVVGVARDGLEALEKIAELAPDVVTLDLIMPNLDGLGVLRALPAEGGPRVVIVSISDGDSALGIEALQNGAVDLVQKPTALATDRLYEMSSELVAKVLSAGASHRRLVPPAQAPKPLPRIAGRVGLIVVGTSTGGPQALTRLLTALPGDLPCPVAVALHIPAGYTDALAKRLDDACALRVFEASEGAALTAGSVVIARGGINLRVRSGARGLTTHLDPLRTASPFLPSVDVLFESAAVALGPAVLGVVLTGMGSDGVEGARAIHRAQGRTLTEAESSCVVYGMPRAVVEADLSAGSATIEDMAEMILQRL